MVFISSKKCKRKLRMLQNRRAYEMEIQLTHAMISVVTAFIILGVPLLLFLLVTLALEKILGSRYNTILITIHESSTVQI